MESKIVTEIFMLYRTLWNVYMSFGAHHRLRPYTLVQKGIIERNRKA